MPEYYHGGRDGIDPSKHYPEHLDVSNKDCVMCGLPFDPKKDNGRNGESHLHKTAAEQFAEQFKAKHPLTSPNKQYLRFAADGTAQLKRPPMFCPVRKDKDGNIIEVIETWDPWIPGSIVLSLVGPPHMYRVIPPGGKVAIDPYMHSEAAVKSACPHLLTEEEIYAHRAAAQAELAAEQKPAEKKKTKTEAQSLRSE